MRNVERGFLMCADRYQFDSGMCTIEKGYAQVDTSQDAWYYGTWANPFERKVVTYAEGDVIIVTLDTDKEFVQEIKDIAEWHKKDGYKICIDCGFGTSDDSKRLFERFKTLGLGKYLH